MGHAATAHRSILGQGRKERCNQQVRLSQSLSREKGAKRKRTRLLLNLALSSVLACRAPDLRTMRDPALGKRRTGPFTANLRNSEIQAI